MTVITRPFELSFDTVKFVAQSRANAAELFGERHAEAGQNLARHALAHGCNGPLVFGYDSRVELVVRVGEWSGKRTR